MEVAIIGAGISGLGAAYTLVKAGIKRVTIYEAQDYIGGRIKSLKHGNLILTLSLLAVLMSFLQLITTLTF